MFPTTVRHVPGIPPTRPGRTNTIEFVDDVVGLVGIYSEKKTAEEEEEDNGAEDAGNTEGTKSMGTSL